MDTGVVKLNGLYLYDTISEQESGQWRCRSAKARMHLLNIIFACCHVGAGFVLVEPLVMACTCVRDKKQLIGDPKPCHAYLMGVRVLNALMVAALCCSDSMLRALPISLSSHQRRCKWSRTRVGRRELRGRPTSSSPPRMRACWCAQHYSRDQSRLAPTCNHHHCNPSNSTHPWNLLPPLAVATLERQAGRGRSGCLCSQGSSVKVQVHHQRGSH